MSRARPGVFSRNAIACERLAAQQLSFRFQEFSRLGIQEDEGSSKGSFRDMKITPGLFEAYLKCPTKCWLRATGERSAGNSYSEWVNAQNDSYRLTGTPRLVAAFRNDEVLLSRDIENFKVAKWRLAFNFVARAQMDCCALESEIHALRCMPVDGRQELSEFIPIRFVFTNKLSEDDKLLLAFDAFALSRSLELEIPLGKIIHGDRLRRVDREDLRAQQRSERMLTYKYLS